MSDPSDQSPPSPESMTDDARAISADIEVELAEQSENEEAEPLDPLLRLAVARRATDIHIDLMPDGHLVRFRIDGGVREMERLSPQTAKKLLKQPRQLSDGELRLFEQAGLSAPPGSMGRENAINATSRDIIRAVSAYLRSPPSRSLWPGGSARGPISLNCARTCGNRGCGR